MSWLLSEQSFSRRRPRCRGDDHRASRRPKSRRTASVRFRSGPAARPGDLWPAAIGRRRHSAAQFERQQTVSSGCPARACEGQQMAGPSHREIQTRRRKPAIRKYAEARFSSAPRRTVCGRYASLAITESVYPTPYRSWPNEPLPLASDKPRWTEPPPRWWHVGLLGNVSLRGLCEQRFGGGELRWRRGVNAWWRLLAAWHCEFDVRGDL